MLIVLLSRTQCLFPLARPCLHGCFFVSPLPFPRGRYVDAVKKAAEANAAAAEVGAVDQEVVRRGAIVQLADSGIGDEEVRWGLLGAAVFLCCC
jgi:hypothetical protein